MINIHVQPDTRLKALYAGDQQSRGSTTTMRPAATAGNRGWVRHGLIPGW